MLQYKLLSRSRLNRDRKEKLTVGQLKTYTKMSTPENMAEATPGPGPEGGATPSGGSEQTAVESGSSESKVLANAALTDAQRAEHLKKTEETLRARGLLPTSLTEEQQNTVIEAHLEAAGEPGKDPSKEAGIGNYTLPQLLRKARILRRLGPDGQPLYSQEQIDVLIQEGRVGILPVDRFVGFDPVIYAAEPRLQNIAQQILNSGNSGVADEVLFNRILGRIEGLVDNGVVADQALAQQLIGELEELRVDAQGERRPSVDPFLTNPALERIERQASAEGGSQFSLAQARFDYFMSLRLSDYPANLQQELQNRRQASENELRQFRQELEQEQGGEELIEYVRGEAVRFYKRVRRAKREEEYGMDKSQIIASARRGFPELWDDSPEFKELQTKYGGLLNYIYAGIVQEIDRTEYGRSGRPINPFTEEDFRVVRERREEERTRDKKFTAIETHYGTIYRLAAETKEEFPQAVLDFTRERIFALSYTDAEDINKEVEQIREEAGKLLDQNRTRLEQEGQEISENDPYFLRAKALADSVVDVLGYERMLYKGGEEYAPKYKLRFAAEFLAHHDAIYLENPKAALEMYLLSTIREGTYWFGHSWNVEKASEGEYMDYRIGIANEIIEYAATHELFLTDEDFKFREDPEKRNLKYGFGEQDNIERLLLDSDGSVRTELETKLRNRNAPQLEIDEALRRHDTRVGIFREIKQRNDQKDGLAGLTPERRKQAIRSKIWEEMQKNLGETFMKAETELAIRQLRAAPDLDAYDKIIWKWVEVYNKHRIEIRQPNISILEQMWYPSGWDQIRMRIDRPTKVLDRELSGDELKAMFEPSELLYVDRERLSEKERKALEEDIKFKLDEARFGFALARSYQIFNMEDTLLGGMRARLTDPITGKYIGKLYGDDPETLEVNRRLGLTDATGNVINSDRKVFRVFDVIQARLQIAIEKEEAVINQAKAKIQAAANPTERETAERELVQILVNAQFVGTHAMKDLGLVEGNLPVWSYNFLDMIDSYAKVLSNYRVKVGTGGLEITHNSKKEFYEIQERGRRALKAETDRAAKEFMSGTFPIFEKDEQGRAVPMVDKQGNPVQAKGKGAGELIAVVDPQTRDIIAVSGPVDQVIKDPQGNPYVRAQRSLTLYDAGDDWGEQKEISERIRISSKGAVKGNLQIVEPRYNLSSSGGVVFTEAIPQIADLGFYPMSVWLGVTSIRGLHSYSKRRDEVEAHEHHFIDVMDPVRHGEAQAAAYNSRKALTGGKIKYRGSEVYTPGFLKEPFHAAFKGADWLQEQQKLAQSYGMDNTVIYLGIMQHGYRRAGKKYSQFLDEWTGEIPFTSKEGQINKIKVTGKDLERYRQMSYLDFGIMTKSMNDAFYQTMYGIIDYFQYYLDTETEVESNRIGRAPRNYEYDNILKWYEFRKLIRESMTRSDPEKGFIIRHGYSPEVGSEIAIKEMETVLDDADYFNLRDYERDRLAQEGAEILSKALSPTELSEGFIIPDERKWRSLDDDLREALETVRRRGLLPFMIEEGYKLTNQAGKEMEILGHKIPPLAQVEIVKLNKDKSKRASW